MTAMTLTREDWLAASIGARDADVYGCSEPAAPRETLGWFARALVWVMGEKDAPRPLANPRLEAMRRFGCAVRSGHQPGVVLVSGLHALGVQPAQLAQISSFLQL